MRIRILALLGFATPALMSPIDASAQYYFPPGNHRLFGRVLRGHLQPERYRSNKTRFCVGSRQYRGQLQSVYHRGCPVESRGAAGSALRILLDRGLHTRACILLLISGSRLRGGRVASCYP